MDTAHYGAPMESPIPAILMPVPNARQSTTIPLTAGRSGNTENWQVIAISNTPTTLTSNSATTSLELGPGDRSGEASMTHDI